MIYLKQLNVYLFSSISMKCHLKRVHDKIEMYNKRPMYPVTATKMDTIELPLIPEGQFNAAFTLDQLTQVKTSLG